MSPRTNDLRADIARYHLDFPGRKLSATGLIARSAGFQAVAVYRLGRKLHTPSSSIITRCLKPLLWLIYVPLSGLIVLAYGIRLDTSAQIGPGLYIGHIGGIDVRCCKLGEHCSIAQQAQIGPAADTDKGPDIGNRVWIGAHAKVLGAFTVGDGATIAAGAHVCGNVPASALVAGNPARVVKLHYDNSAILGDAPASEHSPIRA